MRKYVSPLYRIKCSTYIMANRSLEYRIVVQVPANLRVFPLETRIPLDPLDRLVYFL